MIYNYTPKQQRFRIHTVLPKGSLDVASCNLKPLEIKEEEKVTWELPRIPSTAMYEVSFDLKGMDPEAFSETEVFVSGINPVDVMGADPLPGDWDLQGVNFTEVEAPSTVQAAEDEEEEPDYDESGEDLNDEQ